MQYLSLPIELARPSTTNPRMPLKPNSPRYRRLAQSLQDFGFVQPIVWNESTGTIVGGEQRAAIWRAAGHSHIPAVVVQLSSHEEAALRIALNNALIGSTWNHRQLRAQLLEFRETPGFPLLSTGFPESDLNNLEYRPQVD